MKPQAKKVQSTKTPESALRRLLALIATHAIKLGYSTSQLTEMLAQEYVLIAAKKAKLRNGRVNKAAVAAISGVARSEISKILDQRSAGTAEAIGVTDLVERLVVAWATDPDYLDGEGIPRRLPIHGAAPSMASIARKYASDLTPKAVLAALETRGLISMDAGSVKLRKQRRRGKSAASISEMERLISAVGTALGSEALPRAPAKLALAELNVESDLISKILERQVERAVPILFEDLAAAANSIKKAAPASAAARQRKLITVVFSLEVESGK